MPPFYLASQPRYARSVPVLENMIIFLSGERKIAPDTPLRDVLSIRRPPNIEAEHAHKAQRIAVFSDEHLVGSVNWREFNKRQRGRVSIPSTIRSTTCSPLEHSD